MLEYLFYGVEVSGNFLLSDEFFHRINHTRGFIGVHPRSKTMILIFESEDYANEFFKWSPARKNLTLIKGGTLFVPVKDIPKYRRRYLKKYLKAGGKDD